MCCGVNSLQPSPFRFQLGKLSLSKYEEELLRVQKAWKVAASNKQIDDSIKTYAETTNILWKANAKLSGVHAKHKLNISLSKSLNEIFLLNVNEFLVIYFMKLHLQNINTKFWDSNFGWCLTVEKVHAILEPVHLCVTICFQSKSLQFSIISAVFFYFSFRQFIFVIAILWEIHKIEHF